VKSPLATGEGAKMERGGKKNFPGLKNKVKGGTGRKKVAKKGGLV